MTDPVLVEVTRGPLVESRHRGAVAVADADGLVKEVMQTRGYPMGSFDQRAADISVDHSSVVTNYRAAHDIAAREAGSRHQRRAGLDRGNLLG